jgi:hypothetical protein
MRSDGSEWVSDDEVVEAEDKRRGAPRDRVDACQTDWSFCGPGLAALVSPPSRSGSIAASGSWSCCLAIFMRWILVYRLRPSTQLGLP